MVPYILGLSPLLRLAYVCRYVGNYSSRYQISCIGFDSVHRADT
jgi:hypothetical protein